MLAPCFSNSSPGRGTQDSGCAWQAPSTKLESVWMSRHHYLILVRPVGLDLSKSNSLLDLNLPRPQLMLNIGQRQSTHILRWKYCNKALSSFAWFFWQVQDGAPFVCDGAQPPGQEPSLTKACLNISIHPSWISWMHIMHVVQLSNAWLCIPQLFPNQCNHIHIVVTSLYGGRNPAQPDANSTLSSACQWLCPELRIFAHRWLVAFLGIWFIWLILAAVWQYGRNLQPRLIHSWTSSQVRLRKSLQQFWKARFTQAVLGCMNRRPAC